MVYIIKQFKNLKVFLLEQAHTVVTTVTEVECTMYTVHVQSVCTEERN